MTSPNLHRDGCELKVLQLFMKSLIMVGMIAVVVAAIEVGIPYLTNLLRFLISELKNMYVSFSYLDQLWLYIWRTLLRRNNIRNQLNT